jgi:dephospho-CoA kinase
VHDRLTGLEAPYCLVVIPLLVEAGMGNLVHRVLVVDVPEALQIRRVIGRDRVDEAQVRKILSAQANREQRLKQADDVIVNDADLATLDARVADLHQKYLTLAAEQSPQG